MAGDRAGHGDGTGHGERRRDPEAFDIVTPTEHEARRAEIAERQRRYFAVMLPCIVLVLFGFFVPAPEPLRVAALAVGAVLPPVAAVVGNGGIRRGGWRR